MGLAGSLATLSFADVLQLLGSTRRTGTLHLRKDRVEWAFCLREGMVYCVRGEERHSVARALASVGRVTEGQIATALALQATEPKYLGLLLVETGAVAEDVMRRYLQNEALELASRLAMCREALFRFDEFDVPKRGLVSLELSVEELLMEAYRQTDEVDRLRTELPSDDAVFDVQLNATATGELDQTLIRAVYRKLEKPRTLRELKNEVATSEFALLSVLRKLIDKGVLRVTVSEKREPPPIDWVTTCRRQLDAGAYELAVDGLRRGLSFERGNSAARQLLDKAEAMLVTTLTRGELSLASVPQALCILETLGDRKLTPVEAFLLTRIDGETDLEGLVEGTPLPACETLLAIRRLLTSRLIQLKAPVRSSIAAGAYRS